eukprot:TRINITY_DN10166_c0_g1_i1.p1 TRINITY_DN10166_c0_g1~~TRINITY_DN10166_c0_g1_i1.p1  ORF type:complete len:155 (+),score=17.17 TRINITY_DN10166_c0_g1_i1:89-553(+)
MLEDALWHCLLEDVDLTPPLLVSPFDVRPRVSEVLVILALPNSVYNAALSALVNDLYQEAEQIQQFVADVPLPRESAIPEQIVKYQLLIAAAQVQQSGNACTALAVEKFKVKAGLLFAQFRPTSNRKGFPRHIRDLLEGWFMQHLHEPVCVFEV